MTSWVATPSCCAVAGLISATLSQLNLVIGLGSSSSQPFVANRPSYSDGSGRNTTSTSVDCPLPCTDSPFAHPGRTVTDLADAAELGTTPSLSVWRHHPSKSPPE